MRIQSILDAKGSRVEAIDSDMRVEDAARALADLGIGSLVVRNGAVVAGILDERDIVHGLAKHGRAVCDLPVAEVMRREPVTCTPDQSVREVMAAVTARRVRHVLVIGPLGPCGIVSIGDAVKQRLEEAELEVSVLRDYARSR
ncbi:MAG TPA: CBS domain-containing protein [Myxococcota bacterium]|nr:CBS domain-containing protein [Myxococcota bacterium]